jgi:hypothetical protein
MAYVTNNGAVVTTTDPVDPNDVVYNAGIAIRKSDGAMHVYLIGLNGNPATIGPLSVEPRSNTMANFVNLDGLDGELAYPTDWKAITQFTGTPGNYRVYLPDLYGDFINITELDDTPVNGGTGIATGAEPFYQSIRVSGVTGSPVLVLDDLIGNIPVVIAITNATASDTFSVQSSLPSIDVKVGQTILFRYVFDGADSIPTAFAATSVTGVSSGAQNAASIRTYRLTGQSLNAAAGDLSPFAGLPSKYKLRAVRVYDANAVPVLAQLGLYTAAAGGGTAIVAPTTLTGNTSAAKIVDLTIADTTTYKTATTLYPRRVVSQGSSLTVSIEIEIEDLTGGF